MPGGAPGPAVPEQAPPAPPPVPRADIYDPLANGEELIAKALERARLRDTHVLIEWGGNWCGWCHKLHHEFNQNELIQPLVAEEFELVLIDAGENQELLKKYGGEDADFAYPHLTVLNADGKVLTNQETGSLEIGPRHDPEKVAAFLKKWSPEQKDAETLLQAALSQAKAENKSVLLHVGDPYCGWCVRLSRFLHGHQEQFAKDYVLLHVDTQRMLHGQAVADRFQPKAGNIGHPWMAILAADGTTRSSSIDAAGENIGCPSSPEEIEHFLTMLRSTRQQLTDQELDQFSLELNQERERREQKRLDQLVAPKN